MKKKNYTPYITAPHKRTYTPATYITLQFDGCELEVPLSKKTFTWEYVWNKLTPLDKIYLNPSQLKLEIYHDLMMKYTYDEHYYSVEKYGIFSHNQAFITFGMLIDNVEPNIYDHYLITIAPVNITAYRLTDEFGQPNSTP